jgi:hypothetical protein
MANYSKRDARKKWVEDMVANRKPPSDDHPLCHCGDKAVIGYYPGNGRPNQFFCAVHEAEADALIGTAR